MSKNENKDDYLFFCSTRDGHAIKAMFELLQKLVKGDASINITKDGIKMIVCDKSKTKLFVINLRKDNFTKFILNTDKTVIGVNLNNFYKILKTIKKKGDILKIYINKNEENKLNTKITSYEENKNCDVVGHINILMIQSIDTTLPKENDKSITVTDKEFQKIKQLNKIHKTIEISSNGHTIEFFSNKEGIISKKVLLEDEDDENNDEYTLFKQTYDASDILNIVKFASVSSNIKIYFNKENPLHFKMYVGILGVIDIYMKSHENNSE